jgi:hypothetical protein
MQPSRTAPLTVALCPPGISQNAGTISLMWDDLKTTERTSVDGPQKKDSGPTLAV